MAKKKKLPKAQYGQQMSGAGSDSFKAKGFNSSPIFGQLANMFTMNQLGKKAAQDFYTRLYADAQNAKSAEKNTNTNTNTNTNSNSNSNSATTTNPTTPTTPTTPDGKKKGGSVKSKKKK